MQIALEILKSVSSETKWRPKPLKEKDTRWLTNGRSAESILHGFYIQDACDAPFWVLLAKHLVYIYKQSDWRVLHLNCFADWMLNPRMIFGLWMEAEAVKYFEVHYNFHASTGELDSRPSFRSLDLWFEITDHSFPW